MKRLKSLFQVLLILVLSGTPEILYRLATGGHLSQDDFKRLLFLGWLLAAGLAWRTAEPRLKGQARLYGEILWVTAVVPIGYLFSPWAAPGADAFAPRGWWIGLGLWLVLTAVALLGAVVYRRNEAWIRAVLGRPGPWLRGVVALLFVGGPAVSICSALWTHRSIMEDPAPMIAGPWLAGCALVWRWVERHLRDSALIFGRIGALFAAAALFMVVLPWAESAEGAYSLPLALVLWAGPLAIALGVAVAYRQIDAAHRVSEP